MIYISSAKFPGAISMPRFPSPSLRSSSARRLLAAYEARSQADFWVSLYYPLRFIPICRAQFILWTERWEAANSTILLLSH